MYQVIGGLRAGMGYLRHGAKFVRITSAGAPSARRDDLARAPNYSIR